MTATRKRARIVAQIGRLAAAFAFVAWAALGVKAVWFAAGIAAFLAVRFVWGRRA
ncbi:MAG: hypothetical protein KDJ90_06610 [Nitratireductor sp.]|nr:hypothetical protein [Nitratireductor sp.]